jgi:site-specific recombinase XerD
MLERYFIRPETVDRIRASWIGEPIERYVISLSERGYAGRTIHRRVPLLMRFGEVAWSLGAREHDELPAHVDAFIDIWIKEHRPKRIKKPNRSLICRGIKNSVQNFLLLVLPGYSDGSKIVREPFSDKVPGFFSYLRRERGLREITVGHYLLDLRRFEKYLSKMCFYDLCDLSPMVLSAFISDSSRFLGKGGMRQLCCILRVFLRYLYREKLITKDLSYTVEPPQMYRLSDIPRSISWDEVKVMLDTVDRRAPTGKRDYAILLLLLTYGLRASEVSRLTLDNIDWKRERLYILERKTGQSSAYPLSVVVGEAILDYIKHGRPEICDRHLFFRAYAPKGPMTYGAISSRTSYYLRKAGIQVNRPGSHTLRHTCVQRLVEANFSYKMIGDYVGHRSVCSTEIYSKIDIEALREVALGNGEDIL